MDKCCEAFEELITQVENPFFSYMFISHRDLGENRNWESILHSAIMVQKVSSFETTLLLTVF